MSMVMTMELWTFPYRMADRKSKDPHLETQPLFLPALPPLQMRLGGARIYGEWRVERGVHDTAMRVSSILETPNLRILYR